MKLSNYVKEIPQHVKIKFENVATDVAIHSRPPKSGSKWKSRKWKTAQTKEVAAN